VNVIWILVHICSYRGMYLHSIFTANSMLMGLYVIQSDLSTFISEMLYGTTHKNRINPYFVVWQIHVVRYQFTNMCTHVALFWVNGPIFCAKFFGKNIFKNHNIGPPNSCRNWLSTWGAARSCEQIRFFFPDANLGCQMVYFQTKNLNLGKFWTVL
jgi:hypothetical protein